MTYGDLEEANTDLVNARKSIKALGAKDEDIIELRNDHEAVNVADVSEAIKTISKSVNLNKDNNEKTFIFVYYAGHGVMNNYVEIVCNVPPSADPAVKREKIFYALEK